MTAADIAQRMHCSRGSVTIINRKFQVRKYLGRRTAWTVPETGQNLLKKALSSGAA
jgi:hypothetical protein